MFRHIGLRHVALNVKDVERSGAFYARFFGMKVVWRPDPDNLYLSSGGDNLALHRAETGVAEHGHQALDHIGFVVGTAAEVEEAFNEACKAGLEIVHPLRRHRDGSVSFYIRDPDGIVVQVLYEPNIARGNGEPRG